MSNTSLAQKIMERADAALQFQYLQDAFDKERHQRKKFREWITEDIKAEFINGAIITHSPVKKRHWVASNLLSRLLSYYVSFKEIGSVGVEKVMISLTRNDYEPDIVFFSKEKMDKFKEDQVLFPAPDFVVEILSPKTAKHDKTVKKEDYALHGIPEYWIIDPVKQRVEQYTLLPSSTKYFPAKVYQSNDSIESTVIEGFEITVKAIFEEAANLKAMQELMKNT